MFIGDTGIPGLALLLDELIDNSMEEAVAGRASAVSVTFHADHSISIADDGPGEVITAVRRFSDDEDGKAVRDPAWALLRAFGGRDIHGSGIHLARSGGGVDRVAVNALSDWLEVTIRRDGQAYHQRFERGAVVDHAPGDAGTPGTLIRFRPDGEILARVERPTRGIRERLRVLSYLVPHIRITFTDEAVSETVTFTSREGVAELVELFNLGRAKQQEVCRISYRAAELHLDLALQYSDGWRTQILSFANHRNTPDGGVHEKALWRALVQVMNDVARQHDLIKKGSQLTARYVARGLCAVVSVRLARLQLGWPTRSRLLNDELLDCFTHILREGLERNAAEHPETWRGIVWDRVPATQFDD